jgi:hypothetical protein
MPAAPPDGLAGEPPLALGVVPVVPAVIAVPVSAPSLEPQAAAAHNAHMIAALEQSNFVIIFSRLE